MAIDYETLFGSDDYDPCEALRALRPQYMRRLAGEGEKEVRFRDRKVVAEDTDLETFGRLISQLEAECRAKRGLRPRRMAIIVAPFRR